MGTAEAIFKLREGAPLSRKELADAINVSERSIHRYEAGSEPNAKVLREFSRVARAKGLHHLADVFESKRRADIISAVQKGSAGSERRIPLPELSQWDDTLSEAWWGIEKHVLSSEMEQVAFQLLKEYAGMIEAVRAEIHFRVAPHEQQNYLSQFNTELQKRVMPDGKLDLTSIALGPDVKQTEDRTAVRVQPEDTKNWQNKVTQARNKLHGAPKRKAIKKPTKRP